MSKRRAATIYEVAERAGVSIATVSRTLKRPEVVAAGTREKVQLAVRELDYLPDGAASSLAARRQEAHGLILPELTGLYYAELVAGYESTAEELGQSLVVVLANGKDDLTRAATRLAGRVDGLAIMGSAGVPDELVTSLATKVPVVIIAGEPHESADLVQTESRSPAAELTGRLLDSGRRDLRFVGDPNAAVDVRHRYEGFVDAHRERGLEPGTVLCAAMDEPAGRAVAQRLIESGELPDGLVCANDLIAVAALDVLIDAGVRVPDDIAVTGWDDVMAAKYVRPRLTTAGQPVRELAALAARRLHERVSGTKELGATQVLPCEVVVRESCGTRNPQGK